MKGQSERERERGECGKESLSVKGQGGRERERAEYMIAWRDRYIERLQEQLAGREEENALLSALLFCALCGGEKEDGKCERYIAAEALRVALREWSCEVARGEEGYLLRFSKKECADGGEAAKG